MPKRNQTLKMFNLNREMYMRWLREKFLARPSALSIAVRSELPQQPARRGPEAAESRPGGERASSASGRAGQPVLRDERRAEAARVRLLHLS